MTASVQPHEDLAYHAGDPSIFLGLVINPTKGRWLSLNGTSDDAELIHAYGQALAASDLESGGEYEICDHEGFPFPPSTIEEAALLAELLDELSGDQADALGVWIGYVGKHYALYENGTLRDAWSVQQSFEDAYEGTYASVKAFGEEKFAEILEGHQLPEDLQATLQNWFDAEAYAEAELSGDSFWGDVPGGIAVIARN